jgi:hypothetical protein
MRMVRQRPRRIAQTLGIGTLLHGQPVGFDRLRQVKQQPQGREGGRAST